jgi:uncharacterized protein
MIRLRAVLFGLAVLFPMLTLVPLGSLWLWQNGWLLYWVVGAFIITSLCYALASRLFPSQRIGQKQFLDRYSSLEFEDREKVAWDAVVQLGDRIDPNEIQSRNDILILAVKTIEIVAHELQPLQKDPVWNFTIPEILLLTERVSARLRPIVIETLPLGEQLTVGQALRMYEWRSAVGIAEKAYDVWRLLRIFNPIAAVTQEAREKITKQIVASVRDDLTKRVMRVFTLEVGLAAIDLYGGRIRAGEAMVPSNDTAEALEVPSQIGFSRFWREAKKVTRTARGLYTKSSHKPPGPR